MAAGVCIKRHSLLVDPWVTVNRERERKRERERERQRQRQRERQRHRQILGSIRKN